MPGTIRSRLPVLTLYLQPEVGAFVINRVVYMQTRRLEKFSDLSNVTILEPDRNPGSVVLAQLLSPFPSYLAMKIGCQGRLAHLAGKALWSLAG